MEASSPRVGVVNVLGTVALLLILYLFYRGLTAPDELILVDRIASLALAASMLGAFGLRGKIKRHFFGVSREGLPTEADIDTINCDAFRNAKCQASCKWIKDAFNNLLHSGALRTKRQAAWKMIKYGAAAGGIATAVIGSGGLAAVVGAGLCVPGALEFAEDSQKNLGYWEARADELRNKWAEFLRECLYPPKAEPTEELKAELKDAPKVVPSDEEPKDEPNDEKPKGKSDHQP